MDETSTELYEQGYTLEMSESKWDSVASTYAEMENQRKMNLFVSVLTIGLCPILFVFLILILYCREFAIRELFGGHFHHTFLAYAVPFSVTSVVAAAIGFGFSFWEYRQKLLPRKVLRKPLLPILILLSVLIGVVLPAQFDTVIQHGQTELEKLYRNITIECSLLPQTYIGADFSLDTSIGSKILAMPEGTIRGR